MTATATLATLATLAESALQPQGRAAATAATLRQEGEIAGDIPCTLGALKGAFERLALAPQGVEESGPVKGRRATCGDLAALIDGPAEDPAPVAAVFRAVEARFQGSDDPRQRSIAERAGREAAELGG